VEMNITTNNGDRYKYKMRYKYDEAGNRTRKQMYRSRISEETWTLYNDEVYIRDAKGNETAVYENSNLQYINIWGAGLEGKVRKDDRDNTIYSYYYKDHLGSITAVMDGASGTITQAQDYDAWGDICRTYSTTDTTINKFTGKERDTETGYDYFGARYYDSRISVWLSPDPLFEKHLQWSPYNYVLRNPFVLIDPDGRQLYIIGKNNTEIFELWDKDYLTFNSKNGLVSVKENISLNDLSENDLEIYNFVKDHKDKNGKNVMAYIISEDNPYYLDINGKKNFFLAGAYDENKIEDESNIIIKQHLYLKHIYRFQAKGIYRAGNLVEHEIYERIISVQNSYNYSKSHELAEKYYGSFNHLWFERDDERNYPIIKLGYKNKITNEPIPFFKYDLQKEKFEYNY